MPVIINIICDNCGAIQPAAFERHDETYADLLSAVKGIEWSVGEDGRTTCPVCLGKPSIDKDMFLQLLRDGVVFAARGDLGEDGLALVPSGRPLPSHHLIAKDDAIKLVAMFMKHRGDEPVSTQRLSIVADDVFNDLRGGR